MYTLDDYATAKALLAEHERRWDSYSGNNPDKFRADIDPARAKLHAIETELKALGVLQRTLTEARDAELDKAFPEARSKQVVEWNDKKYIRRFQPVSQSLSGTSVKAWHKYWQELSS